MIIFLLLKDKKNLSLTEIDASRLSAIAKILKDTSHYHISTFSDVDIALLVKLMKSWPVSMLFPGDHAQFLNFSCCTPSLSILYCFGL